MNRLKYRVLGALAVLVCGGSVAVAQPPVPGGVAGAPRPTQSPYLNLLRQGSPAINYFGIVRPEMQFRQQIQSLQGEIAVNQQLITELQTLPGELPVTGHGVQFLNTGGYFMNNPQGPGGAGVRPLGAGGVGITQPMQRLGTPAGGGAMTGTRRR